jgi:aspartate aminotransferase
MSPTAAVDAGQDLAVLSTGDVRLPVHPVGSAPPARRSDQAYRQPAGDRTLRTLIAESAGGGATAAQVLVTPGARQAILATLCAVLTPGDEVLVPAPYWASYPHLIGLAGGTTVVVPGEVGDGRPDIGGLEARRTGRTRAVIVNSPRNPDGAVVEADVLRHIVRWADESGLVVLFDQVYRGVVLTPDPAPSITDLYDELPAHCVIVDGLSKSHALAGLRVGWALAAEHIVQPATAVASHFIGHTCGSAQDTACQVLAGGEADRRRIGAGLAANRDIALDELAAVPGVSCRRPTGGIFLFPDVREWLAGAPEEVRRSPDRWLADRHRVAVVNRAAFGAPGFLRLSFALPAHDLVVGLRRLQAALEQRQHLAQP